ncbi:MAG: GtrA family protein [Candidatus Aenigmarchaeota archaeon]|nr:GtrA family protein [Candidatus Aenigmarchaeota archaeon]
MRVFKFSFVGLSGLLVNEFILWFFTDIVGFFYLISSIISIIITCTSNFLLNDNWTFRERRRGNVFKRLTKYYSISAGTLVINISVLFILTNFLGIYYLISNIFGILVAFSWSYFSNLRWTWFVKSREILKPLKNPMVSMVIPASNKEGAKDFVSRVSKVLGKNNIKKEIIVVDNFNSSVLNGFSRARGDVIGVVHPFHSPEAVSELIKPIMNNESDIVIGSRYADGSELNCPFGNRISHRFKSLLARGLVDVRDPLSGFFFFNKDVIKAVGLNPGCYNPGLEVLVKGNYGNVREMPYSLTRDKNVFMEPGIFSYLKTLIKLYWYKMNK